MSRGAGNRAERELQRLNETLEQRVIERTDLLQMLGDVARAANEARSVGELLEFVLRRVCEHNGWCYGHVYMPDEADPQRLLAYQSWYEQVPGRFEAFRQATLRAPMRRGEGLPGRVHASGRPEWTHDIAGDLEARRAELGADLGVRTAAAFPVKVEDRVVAVIEVFSDEESVPDRKILDTMAGVGTQVGLVIERKRAEKRLRDSEERFRLLVEGVKDYAIFLLDAEGRVASWNPGAERIYGYRAEEVIGLHVAQFYPPEAAALGKPQEHLQRAVAEGRREEEGWRVCKRGKRFWGSALITALWNESGGLRGYAKVTRDDTKRRAAEIALRESEQRFRVVFQNAAIGICICSIDGEGRMVRTNRAFNAMLGYDVRELNGRKFDEITHPDDRALSRQLYQELLGGTRKRFQIEKRYFHKEGQVVWGLLTASLIRDAKGVPINTVALVQDVTERVTAEQELRQVHLSLEHATEGIARLDMEGRYVALNRTFAEMVGYSREELIGRSWESLVFKPDVEAARRVRERMRQVGRAETEERAVRRDGTVFPRRVVLWRSGDGEHEGYYCFVKDITERKRLERQIADSIVQQQRHIGQQLHDSLGQQLTGVAMLAASLERKLASRAAPETQKASELAKAAREAQSEIRALSHGLWPVAVEADGLMGALEKLTSTTATLCDLDCEFECDHPVLLEDNNTATQLYHIAQEAITNAVRHARAERIVVRLEAENGRIVMNIRDDGVGLPDNGSRSGLGLRIMKYRADILGATLDLRNADGGGTAVTCTLQEG